MKKIILPILLAVSPLISFSQEEISETMLPLIKKNLYDSANRVADAYLKQHPQSPDAYVMKGNVIYYRFSQSEPGIALNGNPDESIYNTSMGSIEDNPIILPPAVADSITALFLKGLEIDKTREDIYEGCSYVYSISLQTEKLTDMLAKMKLNLKTDSSTPYTWADYAQNMMERNDFDNGMKVYRKIADLFPTEGGVWSDMAAQYYKQGNAKKAKECADMAMKKPNLDEITCKNIFFIYGVLEEYDLAIAADRKACEMAHNNKSKFYEGLVKWVRENSKAGFSDYVKATATDTPDLGDTISNFILSDDFGLDFDSYTKLTGFDMNDAYKILMHKYFKIHSSFFLPQFNYAEALTYNARYEDAVKAFNEIKTDTISKTEKEGYLFFSAWANYKAGNAEAANAKWEQLLTSDNFYRKSAAAYFLGKYYMAKDSHSPKAASYFRLVSADASQSKYASYCKNMLDKNWPETGK